MDVWGLKQKGVDTEGNRQGNGHLIWVDVVQAGATMEKYSRRMDGLQRY